MKKQITHKAPKCQSLQLAEFIYKDELSKAEYALGNLQGYVDRVGIKYVLPALAIREAIFSSRLAGIEGNVEEVFKYLAGGSPKDAETIAIANLYRILRNNLDPSEKCIKNYMLS